jgi:hypothetical protein
MSNLTLIAARVAAGATVDFRPTGSSMAPLIRSRQLVTVAPVDPAEVVVGDIVLARVAGAVYLHLVSAVDPVKGRVQISNNRGRVNGWTGYARVYGICTAVDGRQRPRNRRTTAPSPGETGSKAASETGSKAASEATAPPDGPKPLPRPRRSP